jgi:predicted RNase H-like nuclease (RuvC/YqgF family)
MSKIKRCEQCERLAEENSNLEKLIQHLKADKYREIKARQEAEGDLTIIKGIGQNSPEVKALKKEIKQLKKDAAEMYKYP